jgi:hypothetical protein
MTKKGQLQKRNNVVGFHVRYQINQKFLKSVSMKSSRSEICIFGLMERHVVKNQISKPCKISYFTSQSIRQFS